MSNLDKLEQLENKGMLDNMAFDFVTLKLNMQPYSYNYVWQRWIRSN